MASEEGNQFLVEHFGEVHEAVVDGDAEAIVGGEQAEYLVEVRGDDALGVEHD